MFIPAPFIVIWASVFVNFQNESVSEKKTACKHCVKDFS